MADQIELLDCPMCDFTVLPSDNYILHLHFEQVHTTDSPFVVEDDAESQPPPLPPRPSSKRKHSGDTPSSDEEENIVVCPEPDCGEAVPLSDFNDHLDYHAAESLSFDETTGKYHSHHSSPTMQSVAVAQQMGLSNNTFTDHTFGTDLPDALRRNEGQGRKIKKHAPRHRSNTNSSEKSTLSRSILSFNPFAKLDKTVKPPNKTARLGVSVVLLIAGSHELILLRNPNLVPMPGKIACPSGYMINLTPGLRLLSSIASVETAALSSKSTCRTNLLVLYPFLLSYLR